MTFRLLLYFFLTHTQNYKGFLTPLFRHRHKTTNTPKIQFYILLHCSAQIAVALTLMALFQDNRFESRPERVQLIKCTGHKSQHKAPVPTPAVQSRKEVPFFFYP